MKLQRVVLMICLCTLAPAALFAQAARDASLQVTVVDETRGVLAGATVTLAGIDSSNKAARHPAAVDGPARAGDVRQPRARPLRDQGGVLRLPDAHAAGRPDPQRREPPASSCCRSIG